MSGGDLSMNQGANSRKSLQTAGVPMINSLHEKKIRVSNLGVYLFQLLLGICLKLKDIILFSLICWVNINYIVITCMSGLGVLWAA